MEHVRGLDDHTHPGGLQGLGDSHGDLFGQPLLNWRSNSTGLDETNGLDATVGAREHVGHLTLEPSAVDLHNPAEREKKRKGQHQHCVSVGDKAGKI